MISTMNLRGLEMEGLGSYAKLSLQTISEFQPFPMETLILQ